MADAGPLIAFGRIGKLGLLQRTLGEGLIPKQVLDECLHDLALPGAAAIQSALDQRVLLQAAKAALHHLKTAPRALRTQPRLGSVLSEFSPREVRRLIVGNYELRYEIRDDTVHLLRHWHCHEDR